MPSRRRPPEIVKALAFPVRTSLDDVMIFRFSKSLLILALGLFNVQQTILHAQDTKLKLRYDEKNILHISGDWVPGGSIPIWYIEAYCRPNAHETDWSQHTVIGHKTEVVESSDHEIRLRCRLRDGVIVNHTISSDKDSVDFQITAHNPTAQLSETHWGQPCIRVHGFTGYGDPSKGVSYDYIERSFIFLDGKLSLMPTRDWETKARYTPGQVWAAPGVLGADVNPRPLNPNTPSNALIGCFSKDGKYVLAAAFDPYQELFQGVIHCLHNDFRIGGLKPNETKTVHGKLYILPAHIPTLLERYRIDFPDHSQH